MFEAGEKEGTDANAQSQDLVLEMRKLRQTTCEDRRDEIRTTPSTKQKDDQL